MADRHKGTIGRRQLLRTGFSASRHGHERSESGAVAADTETNSEKRKARYQANSAEVQNYYRVNRLPEALREVAMLIKRSERQARRGKIASELSKQSGDNLNRRSFLRRSGLTAGSLQRSELTTCQHTASGGSPPPPPGAIVTDRCQASGGET